MLPIKGSAIPAESSLPFVDEFERKKLIDGFEEEIEAAIVAIEYKDDETYYTLFLSLLGEELVLKKAFETQTQAERYAKKFLEKLKTLFETGTPIRTEEERRELN